MLAALLPPNPAPVLSPVRDLTLRIEAPPTATVGQAFTVRVWLVNARRTEVTIADPTPLTSWLGTRFVDTLSRGGARVAAETGSRTLGGMWSGQWVVPNRFEAAAFRTLAPGARLLIEARTFGREYVAGTVPGLGENLTAPKRSLPEGEYVYRAEWRSRPDSEATARRWAALGFGIELSPEARALAARRWTGARVAMHRFSITGP